MVQPDSADAQLLAGLRAEALAFEEFTATLEAEQEALARGDVDALNTLAQTKQQQIDRLNRIADQRLQQIAARGFPASRAGMEAWAAAAGSTAREAWRAVLNIARQAHQTNQINGSLLKTRLEHNQQALNALLAATGKSSLYGPDGRTASTAPGNGASRGIIGKA